MAAGVDAVGADVGERRGMQDGVQLAAMDRDLRPSVAGRKPPRFIPDRLAALGEVRQRRGCQPVAGQFVGEPERIELAHGVGQQVDSDAQRLDAIDALEHPDGEAGTVQAQRGRQAADSSTGDDDIVHRTQPTSASISGFAAITASRC